MRTIAIDTEYNYQTPFLVTMVDDELKSYVYRPSISEQLGKIKEVCESSDIRKVFHNATADIVRLANIGVKVVRPYECTLIASNIVDETLSSRNLKRLVQKHLGIETKEANRLKSVIKKYKTLASNEGRMFKWSDIPNEIMIPYAKRDPEYTIKLWYYYQEPLKSYKDIYQFEKSLIPIIVRMMLTGMRVDRKFCRKMQKIYQTNIDSLLRAMRMKVKMNEFNPNSHTQVKKALRLLGIDIPISMKTGRESVSKDMLMLIDDPFVSMILKYRFYFKAISTYYSPLVQYYTSPSDHVAHFDLYQTGAKTGRFSAELIQTFPKPKESKFIGEKHEVRKCIIPHSEGDYLVCIDYRQIEMWLFIHYANCTRLIGRCDKPYDQIDPYLETANILFGKLMNNENLRKPLRDIAKQISLGFIYGLGRRKLVAQIQQDLVQKIDSSIVKEIGISYSWAERVIRSFKVLYPVQEFINKMSRQVYRNGYIDVKFDSSLMKFNRIYHVPQELAYKSVNYLIQGTAAYVIKCAMKRVDRLIRLNRWRSRVKMLMQVHDELIFNVSELDHKEVIPALCYAMEDVVTFKVPILVEPKWSYKSWADVVEYKYDRKKM